MIVRNTVALAATFLVAMPAVVYAQSRKAAPTPQQNTESPPPRVEKTFPLGVPYVAVSLNGKPYGTDRPAFTLDSSLRARGFGGCNTFSATAYPLRQQTFAVGPFALTKKSCSKEVMDAERAFLLALRAAKNWDLNLGQLIIRGDAGELRFDRSL